MKASSGIIGKREISRWVVFALVSTTNLSIAQNLESIGKDDPLTISGGVNMSSVFYRASGIESRRDPFNYFLSGNLNMTLYGWSVPFSFTYSNQQSEFQQPFNQYGLSPTYKWATLHAGYRSMTFSNYTVNGHLVLGGGFDIAPSDRLKISAFYGRLQDSVEEDTTAGTTTTPAYKRFGGGVNVIVGTEKNKMGVVLFKAKDDAGSLAYTPVVSDIRPEENLVIGLNTTVSPHERITISAEYASSAITKDSQSELASAGNAYDRFKFAFSPRTSSSYQNAWKASLAYSLVNASIGAMYERVDPGYRTLGAYYFNNDLETFALTMTSILRKKFNVNVQIGGQRNNLDNQSMNRMTRFTTAMNVNYQLSKRMTIAGNYSNFRTVVNFKSALDVLEQVDGVANGDTLNFTQISQNANLNWNFILNENKERRQNVNVNVTLQQTADVQADVEQPTGAKIYNTNANYSFVTDKSVSISVALNANLTESRTMTSKVFGPSMSVRKSFFGKKLSSGLTASYNNADGGGRTSTVTCMRGNAAITLKDVHQFDVNITWSNRSGTQNNVASRSQELVIQVGYGYVFNSK